MQFSGAGSTDPNNDPLTYDWDFGDGTAHSTPPNPAHTYTTAGTYDAVLTVSDGKGGSATATVHDHRRQRRRRRPDDQRARRRLRSTGSGTTIQLRRLGDRPAGRDAAGLALSWHVSLIHNTHVHDLADFTGKTPRFDAATDHDADAHYRITLTATDSSGRDRPEDDRHLPRRRST